MRLIRKTPRVEKNFSISLIRVGVGIKVICVRVGDFVRWCYDGPRMGFVD